MRIRFVWTVAVFLMLLAIPFPFVAAQAMSEPAKQNQSTQSTPKKAPAPGLSALRDFTKGLVRNEKGRVLSVWDNAALQKKLKETLGEDVFARLYSWVAKDSVGSTPVLVGNVLHTYSGKRHWVDEQHVILFVYFGKNAKDPAANTVQLCWHERSSKGEIVDIWLASGQKPRSLPKDACNLNENPMTLLRSYGDGTTGAWELSDEP